MALETEPNAVDVITIEQFIDKMRPWAERITSRRARRNRHPLLSHADVMQECLHRLVWVYRRQAQKRTLKELCRIGTSAMVKGVTSLFNRTMFGLASGTPRLLRDDNGKVVVDANGKRVIDYRAVPRMVSVDRDTAQDEVRTYMDIPVKGDQIDRVALRICLEKVINSQHADSAARLIRESMDPSAETLARMDTLVRHGRVTSTEAAALAAGDTIGGLSPKEIRQVLQNVRDEMTPCVECDMLKYEHDSSTDHDYQLPMLGYNRVHGLSRGQTNKEERQMFIQDGGPVGPDAPTVVAEASAATVEAPAKPKRAKKAKAAKAKKEPKAVKTKAKKAKAKVAKEPKAPRVKETQKFKKGEEVKYVGGSKAEWIPKGATFRIRSVRKSAHAVLYDGAIKLKDASKATCLAQRFLQ